MESLPVINKTYEVYKKIVEINESLTKRWRFSLGVSVETGIILNLMGLLIMAKNAKPRT